MFRGNELGALFVNGDCGNLPWPLFSGKEGR